MKVTQIFIQDIKEIVNRIENSDYNYKIILNSFVGKIEKQSHNETYTKIIIQNVSESIASVILDCEEEKIKAISFSGLINIRPKELFEKFKIYREAYSVHDDLYFYFFNEDKKTENCIIFFFEPSHGRINVQESDQLISNLTLSWR